MVSYPLISHTPPLRRSRNHESIRRHNLCEKLVAGAGDVLNVTRQEGVVGAGEEFSV